MSAKLISLLVLALAFAGLGLWGQQQHLAAVKAKNKVQALSTELEGTKAALRRSEQDAKDKASISLGRQKRINQLLAQAEVQSKALNEALKQNRGWADAAVPDGVWDALGAPAPSGKAVTRPRVDAAGQQTDPAGP